MSFKSSGNVCVMSFIRSWSFSLTELPIGTSSIYVFSNFCRILRIMSTSSTSCFPCTHVFKSCKKRLLWNERRMGRPVKEVQKHTALDSASSCITCNFCDSSVYLVWNHPEKLGERKNRLYNPTQSPLMPVVSWGPALLKVARKSSGLNNSGMGVAWNAYDSYNVIVFVRSIK